LPDYGRFRDECRNRQWFTDLTDARAVIEALRWKTPQALNIMAWNDFEPIES